MSVRECLLILVLVTVLQLGVFAAEDHSDAPQIDIVYYDEIKDLPNHPEVLLIDVRDPQELKDTGIIPTSINIPLSKVDKELDPQTDAKTFEDKYSRPKPSANTPLIFTCRSGKRAKVAADKAVELGYTNVKYYKGSWIDWAQHEGLPI